MQPDTRLKQNICRPLLAGCDGDTKCLPVWVSYKIITWAAVVVMFQRLLLEMHEKLYKEGGGRTIFAAAVVNNLDSISLLTVFISLPHVVFCPDKTIFSSPLHLRTSLSCRPFPFQLSAPPHLTSFRTCPSEVLLNVTSSGSAFHSFHHRKSSQY